MTLTKAKELLTLFPHQGALALNPDTQIAIHLAIEILRFIILARIASPGSVPALFHGETKEFNNVSVHQP